MDKQIPVEEAIKYLCMIPIPFISGNRDCDTEESQKYSIALNMGVKALELKPCADAVSRQAMFDILVKYKIHESKIAEELEELPSVNSQPKTGHWVYKIYGGFHEQGNWYCSHCDYQYNYGNGYAKYCPECGYEMSEPPTEEVIRDKDYDWIIKR